MPEEITNPGSLREYLATHEGATKSDYLDSLGRFSQFVTKQGLSDSELLHNAQTGETQAA
jgi:hypothetical protein